mmetsp:Transcript_24220/g.42573  ORF Transcript_24220/g.42573 Transcript_24220/m.42573 type:complete len:241 (-) Transcript_24220:352-1074(-)|eukprot:CAMPEP_0178786434 /NCGR_PEP_ID=MMETSP0745-20121128/5312_1 /TAXON_ID=913974 /ORGANISM="Nitzschia punctata, Strain CCMP561" /LENGTH=240 /DNA_ID=CAMNT_0020444203 /DNA_START=114 /DNA_END=836 /DNA_ORIENTATION=-
MTFSDTSNDLYLPSDWADNDTEMMIDMTAAVEELSATSHQEASKVLEAWLSDHETITTAGQNEDAPEDLASIMEVDEQIGANFLDDEVFGIGGSADVDHFCCASPTGPLEELASLNVIINEEDRNFLAPLLENDDDDDMAMLDSSVKRVLEVTANAKLTVVDDKKDHSTIPFANDEQIQQVLKKLAESMKRSQETRKSLTMKTPKTEQYVRNQSVTGVLSSIESSSRQLQTYLQVMQRAV